MNEQKRHLTVWTIAVMLALAVLCYGRQLQGGHVVLADSHDGLYLCSHIDKYDAGPGLAARPKVTKKGGAAGNTRTDIGGQIG